MEAINDTADARPNFGHHENCGRDDDVTESSVDMATIDPSDQYLTMQQAAKLMKVGVRTLYRYLDSGRIPRSYRLPGKRLVARDDIIAFMDQCADERKA